MRDRTRLWLVLALLFPACFYVIPNALGYGWNAAGVPRLLLADPRPTTRVPATDFTITAESWGAAVISEPFNARVADYVRNTELPLWNPYQALGEPYAAQGEGNPLSPISVVRALLPDQLHNVYSTLIFAASGVFLYAFGRQMYWSPAAARFAAAAWIISPALSWHLSRFNYIDQFVLLPVLFWAISRACLARERFPWISTTLAIALFAFGGFPQTAIVALIVGYLFALALIVREGESRANQCIRITATFALGCAIATPYLLPLQEIIQVGYSKNTLTFSLGFDSNVLYSFLFPGLLGPPFGPPVFAPAGTWNNTFAGVGMVLLIISALGISARHWSPGKAVVYRFFVLGAIILLLRALNIAPFTALNAVPVIGLQTPKHAHSLIVFLVVVAAGSSIDSLAAGRRAATIMIPFAVIAYMLLALADVLLQRNYLQPYASEPQNEAVVGFLALMLVVAVVAVGVLNLDIPAERRLHALTILCVGELSFYLLLGVSAQLFYVKLGISTCIVAAALLVASGRWRIAAPAIGLAFAMYAALIALPANGLPNLVHVAQEPAYLSRLRQADTVDYRSFGMTPNFSSTVDMQDLSSVSAFTTMGFNSFVKLVGNRDRSILFAFANSFFMLGYRTSFPLPEYLHWKPVFDWFGVRYLIFDHALFGPDEPTHLGIVNASDDFKPLYDDNFVTVVQVPAAQSKVAFYADYDVVRSQVEIFRRLMRDPARIAVRPMIEATQAEAAGIPPASVGSAYSREIRLDHFQPGRLAFRLDASGAGLAVIRDAYYPGWHVRVNGREVPVVRVNTIARGVYIPGPGHYDVELWYMPDGFAFGALIALVAAIATVLAHVLGGRVPRRVAPFLLIIVILAIAVIFIRAIAGPPSRQNVQALMTSPETFRGFDLRESPGFLMRMEGPTDDRTLVLRAVGKQFPSAQVDPTPLPLAAGDIFIGHDGQLNEVDADSTFVQIQPADDTRLCVLDTHVRASDDFTTTTLPIPVVNVLRYQVATGWTPDSDADPQSSVCAESATTGRIRFGWLTR